MKLIPEAKQAGKLWSVQFGTLTTVLTLLEAWNSALPLWEGVIPAGTFAILAAVSGSLTVATRVIKQEGIK
jgi:hypothetical protein